MTTAANNKPKQLVASLKTAAIGKFNGMKRAADWVGQRVVLAKPIGNGAADHPRLLRGQVTSQEPRGLTFRGDKCGCCGVQAQISRLAYTDVRLIEKADPVRMAYVAEDPEFPGTALAVCDVPRDSADSRRSVAKTVAQWIRDGATVRLLSADEGSAMLKAGIDAAKARMAETE